MNHTHHYSYWHAHEHEHTDDRALVESAVTGSDLYMRHDTGHHHFYANTHEHGPVSNMTPHSHKDKQYHPVNDTDGPYHHHGVADHEEEEEADVRDN